MALTTIITIMFARRRWWTVSSVDFVPGLGFCCPSATQNQHKYVEGGKKEGRGKKKGSRLERMKETKVSTI
jgi:hypothetical protein